MKLRSIMRDAASLPVISIWAAARGPNQMFGYSTNLVLADGSGYVADSQLRRQLAAIALDVRVPSLIHTRRRQFQLLRAVPAWIPWLVFLYAIVDRRWRR